MRKPRYLQGFGRGGGDRTHRPSSCQCFTSVPARSVLVKSECLRDKAEIFASRNRARPELECWPPRTCWMGRAEGTDLVDKVSELDVP
jgi:hypothetical protein